MARAGPSGAALVPALSSSWAPALSSTPQRRREKVSSVMGASWFFCEDKARIAGDFQHRQIPAQGIVVLQRNERIGRALRLPGGGEGGHVGDELLRLPIDRLAELVPVLD